MWKAEGWMEATCKACGVDGGIDEGCDKLQAWLGLLVMRVLAAEAKRWTPIQVCALQSD